MLPISYSAYEETGSPLLSILLTVVSFAPDIFVSMFAGTFIDRHNKKHIVVWLSIAFTIVFLMAGIYLSIYNFDYKMIFMFTLIISIISAFDRLAFSSWYPEIITKGMEAKAYSITNMIYPLMSMVLAPLSSYIYKVIGLGNMMYIAFVFSAASTFITALIKYVPLECTKTVNKFIDDFKLGIKYLKSEPGLLKLYIFLAVSAAIGVPQYELIRMLFQSTAGLGVVLFGIASSVEMASRVIFGGLYYKYNIKKKHRFNFSALVHFLYGPTTFIAFIIGFPAFLVQGFIMRGLGQITYTMREACLASYIKPEMRGRTYAVNSMLTSVLSIPVMLLVGFIAEGMPLLELLAVMVVIEMLSVYFMFIKNKSILNPIYESENTEEKSE